MAIGEVLHGLIYSLKQLSPSGLVLTQHLGPVSSQGGCWDPPVTPACPNPSRLFLVPHASLPPRFSLLMAYLEREELRVGKGGHQRSLGPARRPTAEMSEQGAATEDSCPEPSTCPAGCQGNSVAWERK